MLAVASETSTMREFGELIGRILRCECCHLVATQTELLAVLVTDQRGALLLSPLSPVSA
jgi:hypothetical protein